MRFRYHAIPDAWTDKDGGSGKLIGDWRARWGDAIAGFADDGCGCCVHIIDCEAPGDALDDLEQQLRMVAGLSSRQPLP
jgi:hypothetical protein